MIDERIITRTAANWPMMGLLSLLLLLLLAVVVSADEVRYEPVEVVEVGAWRDAGGHGSDLQFDQSNDGDRLVMLGYASSNDLRVTDRDLETLAILDLPNEDAVIKGLRWSDTGDWVCAWGYADGVDQDLLWLWNGTTYEPSDWLFENYTTPLRQLDGVLFQSSDEIIALAGRDENGTSRLLLVETSTSDIRRDIPWEDNATVVRLGTDMMRLVCIDERGTVTGIDGSDWENVDDLGGHDIAPSSDSLGQKVQLPWMVGYQDGSIAIWGGSPVVHERSAYLGEGPIQGISWALLHRDGDSYYLVGTPSLSGGSMMRAFYYDMELKPDSSASEPIEYASPISSMAGDIQVDGLVWVGFEDGSIRLFNVTRIINLPPEITIESPINGKRYTKDFTATGIVTDDHDNIEHVRVMVQTGIWYNATVTGDRWTYEINVTDIKAAEYVLMVVASDGRFEISNSTQFSIPWQGGEDELFTGNRIILIIVVVALVLFFSWRMVKGRKAEEA